MHDLNKELTDAGDLVGAEGLTPPGEAKVVRAGKNGLPAVTDGPFPEAKEFLAGFWIVEVDSAERAHILYLIFNEGYASSAGPELQRTDLSSEAIRLTRGLHASLPDDGEVTGLLALMLLTDARRAARAGPGGELIPLDEQDRSRWDRSLIAEGVALLTGTLGRGPAGSYQLQAMVAAVHDQAARVEDTDWRQILALYEALRGMSDNPMVALSHAIAAAMVHGHEKGLELLDALDRDARVSGHYRLDAVRAHLFERGGDYQRAVAHHLAAAERTASVPERDYLLKKSAGARAKQRDGPVGEW